MCGQIRPPLNRALMSVRLPCLAKNGSLAGVEVLIFPEASRGAGEGHRPFDLLPESTMTNATVADEVIAADGKTVKLTYKGGEQTLALTPETRIFTVAAGSVADLKLGSNSEPRHREGCLGRIPDETRHCRPVMTFVANEVGDSRRAMADGKGGVVNWTSLP